MYVCLFDWLSVLVSEASSFFYRQISPTVVTLFLPESTWRVVSHRLFTWNATRKCSLAGSRLVSSLVTSMVSTWLVSWLRKLHFAFGLGAGL